MSTENGRTAVDLGRLEAAIHTVADFPEAGVLFKDLSPILGDAALFDLARAAVADAVRPLLNGHPVDAYVGIDSRGFLFAAGLASVEDTGVLLVRKDGKLPPPTISRAAATEYSDVALCLNPDLFAGKRVVLIDDILATGGTALAAIDLIEEAGAELLGAVFVGEIAVLDGRQRVDDRLAGRTGVVLTL